MGRLQDLPPTALRSILDTEPPSDFLSILTLSKPVNEAVCRVAFANISVPDASGLVQGTATPPPQLAQGVASAFLLNPERYGPFVQSLTITDPPTNVPSSGLGLFDVIHEDTAYDAPPPTAVPLSSTEISSLLRHCVNLEDLTWTSSCVPPDGLFECLTTTNAKLRSFTYSPALSNPKELKWDAPSLPLLSHLSATLTSLTLSRLSQSGAKALALLLSALAEDDEASNLEALDLDVLWFDDALCERIVGAGRKLKRLIIGTQGTKLTDVGVIALLEGLETLEELTLSNVEGRLSKTLWSKFDPDLISPSLHKLTICVPSGGPAHSWALDHLQSLSEFPLSCLTSIGITRGSTRDPGTSIPPIPRDLLSALADGVDALTTVDCDWWTLSPDDAKTLVESCSNLEALRMSFDGPFSKLLLAAGSFSSSSKLQKLSINIPSEHAGSIPPSPSVPTPVPPSPVTTRYTNGNINLPPSSPISSRRDSFSGSSRRDSMTSGAGRPSSTYFTEPSPSTSLSQISEVPVIDPSLPLLRDVKKFFKRCPALRKLEWIGRGTWTLDPPSPGTSAPKTASLANIKVDFVPFEDSAAAEGGYPYAYQPHYPPETLRDGARWEGPAAEQVAQDLEAMFPEKEVKDLTPEPTQQRPRRASQPHPKKPQNNVVLDAGIVKIGTGVVAKPRRSTTGGSGGGSRSSPDQQHQQNGHELPQSAPASTRHGKQRSGSGEHRERSGRGRGAGGGSGSGSGGRRRGHGQHSRGSSTREPSATATPS